MSTLAVPGATIYYETAGKGPVLLCISGANGSADLWKPMSRQLSAHFTVVSYDRRGFSRSYLSSTEAQDYDERLATDADDAFALIQHVSGPEEPATVIGNSSGAIVSLELLLRHPDSIRTLIPHEPPAIKLLPDFDDLAVQQHDIYNTYRRSGMPPALKKFAAFIKAGAEAPFLLKAFDPKSSPYTFANAMYWFEREFLTYVFRDFKPDDFRPYREKLLLANGAASDPTALQYRTNGVIADRLGMSVEIVAGAHTGFATHAKEFAKGLLDALQEKDSFYARL